MTDNMALGIDILISVITDDNVVAFVVIVMMIIISDCLINQ